MNTIWVAANPRTRDGELWNGMGVEILGLPKRIRPTVTLGNSINLSAEEMVETFLSPPARFQKCSAIRVLVSGNRPCIANIPPFEAKSLLHFYAANMVKLPREYGDIWKNEAARYLDRNHEEPERYDFNTYQCPFDSDYTILSTINGHGVFDILGMLVYPLYEGDR